MRRVKLIHWKPEEIKQRENILCKAGYKVDSNLEGGLNIIKEITKNPPAAIVIDLSRLPSQGRDFGLLVRKRKGSRHITLVFVDGAPNKVLQIRQLLPDAVFTSWDNIDQMLDQVITNPPGEPIFHESVFAGYSGKSLIEKLGIKSGMTICINNSPEGFDNTLGELPEGTAVIDGGSEECELSIWFCRSRKELEHHLKEILAQSRSGPIWIAWPKNKSDLASDLSQQAVRQIGLNNNLVDYKVCAFDDTWLGLLFKNREK
jgi:hypothetical protein